MNIALKIPIEQKVAYLRTLPAVRERCGQVFQLAQQGKLQYFEYHAQKESEVTDFCLGIVDVSA